MAASTYFAQVQQLYIAYFGRPADTTGQAFWAGVIDAANGNIAAVQAGFSTSAESVALYGNKSNIDKVTAIYQNTFGRTPDAGGLAFWVNQLDTGKLTQAQAAWTIQQSAGSVDAAVVQAKLVAAQAFTAQIDTAAEIQGYQGAGAADSARAFLATVTSTATGLTAVSNAASAVAAAVAVGGTGSTFTFTTGVDTLVGTSGNDTFTADNTGATAQLGAADSVNGGAGVDTLKVFLPATGAASSSFVTPTLTSVENVLINGGALTAYTAATGTTGLTIEAPAAMGATYTVAGQAVTLKGATVAGTTTITSAADTAANVTLNGWGSATVAQTVALTGTAVATANLTATGANSAITLTGPTALKTINVAGDKNLALTTNASALTAINASTATGAVSADISAATPAAAFAFTGGTGNDTLTLAAGSLGTLTAGTQLNGGAGTDTLVIKDLTLAAADYTKLNAAVGFETLGLTTTTAGTAANALVSTVVDASQLTSIKSFAVSNNALFTTDTINNLGAGTTVAFTGSTTAATLTAALGNTATEVSVGVAGAAGVTVGSLTLTGLTTVGLTSNGTSVNTITALNNADNSTITIKGSADLTITGALAATATGSKVDASALTGKLNITGSAQNDIIIGGSGDDTINGGAGADTLTGGAGKDKFTVNAGITAAAADTITDFVTKVDTIAFNGSAAVGSASNVKIATAAVATFDLAKAAADAIFADATTVYDVQQVGSDSYAFYAAAGDSTTAQVVKLSGVSLTAIAATDFVAA